MELLKEYGAVFALLLNVGALIFASGKVKQGTDSLVAQVEELRADMKIALIDIARLKQANDIQ